MFSYLFFIAFSQPRVIPARELVRYHLLLPNENFNGVTFLLVVFQELLNLK